MLRQTIYISRPSYLRLENGRIFIRFLDKKEEANRPIIDLGIIVLDHPQITYTHGLLVALAEENVLVILCNKEHLPFGIYTPLYSHHMPYGRLQLQLNISLPLKKRMWQFIIKKKIENQYALLKKMNLSGNKKMEIWIKQVLSDDSTGREAIAAKHYWSKLMGSHFRRDRFGDMPNPLLNLGYTILRGAVARALIGSGLFPIISFHHKNRHNAHPLADDVMEPYRPFVDEKVKYLASKSQEHITKEDRIQMLNILTTPCLLNSKKYKISTAIEETTASIVTSIKQKDPKVIKYPSFLI